VAAVRETATAAVLCSSGWVREVDGVWVSRGDPTEAALDTLLRRCGSDTGRVRDRTKMRARFPFDAARRLMSAVADNVVYVKGAADSVLPRCVEPPAEADRAAHALAERGLRVLAVATRRHEGDTPRTAAEAERDLHLLGIIALEDPPRESARAATKACRAAGVTVAMVTGDHPGTAAAVAREVGLADDGVDLLVLTGAELPENEAELGELIDRHGVVIARVSPEQKLRIARALQARGHVVAMTGDGVNDGPALRQANIGVAMGRSGTDVAREAADLVLLDDDFSTVVAAIEQGRATFANIRRFLTYHLTDNVAELTPFVVWALSGGSFPLALGVLQILALDIGTDLLPALALGAEPADERVFDQPPVGEHLVDAPLLRRVFGVLGPTEAVVEMGAFTAVLWAAGWRPGESVSTAGLAAASGTAFSCVVLGQMANALACRSMTRPPWRLTRRNSFLRWAILTELVMLGVFLYLRPLAGVLDQSGPTVLGWVLATLALPAVLVADALHKRLRHATA
jgi:magnesium-transporting ATPase (P-type)